MIFVEIDFRKSLHERKLVEYRILPATNKQDNVQYMYRTRSCKRPTQGGLADMSAKVVGGGLQEGWWHSYIFFTFERGWLKGNVLRRYLYVGGLHVQRTSHLYMYVYRNLPSKRPPPRP